MSKSGETEEALDELGQSFQNYLQILQEGDVSIEDSSTSYATMQTNKLVTLDPYHIDRTNKTRKTTQQHMKIVSDAVDTKKPSKWNTTFTVTLAVMTSVVVGVAITAGVMYSTKSKPAANMGILPQELWNSPGVWVGGKEDAQENYQDLLLPHVKQVRKDFSFFLAKNTPVFFDLPGAGPSFVPKALSECYGLSGSSIFTEDDKLPAENHPTDFLITDSICNLGPHFINRGENHRVFLLVQNPALRSVIMFLKKQDPRSDEYDERTAGMNFSEYMTSSLMKKNELTRNILCKSEGEITNDDLLRASDFLRTRSVVGVFQEHRKAFNKYHTNFEWQFNDNIDQCVRNNFKDALSKIQKYGAHGLVEKHFAELQGIIGADFKLYWYARSLA